SSAAKVSTVDAMTVNFMFSPWRGGWLLVALGLYPRVSAKDSSGCNRTQRKAPYRSQRTISDMVQLRIDNKRCDVALLVDAEAGERRASGRFVPERSSVEAYLLDELRRQRLNVTVVPFDAAIDPVIGELRALKPRLVF